MSAALLSKIAPLLNKAIPIGMAANQISKVDPRLKRFLAGAVASGYGLEQAMEQLRGLSADPGQRSQQARERQAAAQGTALPSEKARVREREDEAKGASVLRRGVQLAAGAALAGASPASAIGSLLGLGGGDGSEPMSQAPTADGRNYFQRAMEGVSFLDLDEGLKAKVGSLKQRLDNMEQQGIPYKDRSVQNVIRAMRQLVGQQGIIEQESARFEMGQSQQPQQMGGQQGGGADEQAIAILQQIAQRFGL